MFQDVTTSTMERGISTARGLTTLTSLREEEAAAQVLSRPAASPAGAQLTRRSDPSPQWRRLQPAWRFLR